MSVGSVWRAQTWNKWWWLKKDVILTLNSLLRLDSVRYRETRHLHDSVSFEDELWKSGFKVINAFNCCPRFFLSQQVWHDRYTTVESTIKTLLLQKALLYLWFYHRNLKSVHSCKNQSSHCCLHVPDNFCWRKADNARVVLNQNGYSLWYYKAEMRETSLVGLVHAPGCSKYWGIKGSSLKIMNWDERISCLALWQAIGGVLKE